MCPSNGFLPHFPSLSFCNLIYLLTLRKSLSLIFRSICFLIVIFFHKFSFYFYVHKYLQDHFRGRYAVLNNIQMRCACHLQQLSRYNDLLNMCVSDLWFLWEMGHTCHTKTSSRAMIWTVIEFACWDSFSTSLIFLPLFLFPFPPFLTHFSSVFP